MKLNYPKTIIALLVVFTWSFLKNIEHLIRFTNLDYSLYNHLELGFLYFAFLVPIMILDAFAIWFLLKPRTIGYKIGIANVILSFVKNILSISLLFANADFVKAIYYVGRVKKGLPVDTDMINMVFSKPAVIVLALVTTAITATLFILLYRNKKYFTQEVTVKSTAN
ncbi:MAG: hypothetical protein DKM50_11650 [Candidatus Margulisiibacteriota bacterium]|nr:MAG: hypothetical protein A2X43_02985 [Candidatus Margulisbacteria bacterium GWD2_39_127]OGI01202.1 MAG: hypothetical protein A2X42_06200 [Candidatus Margulisbacteria bacterium GWF2_38_17]OGI09837.1 MAG: hypothetical protein A2X41_09920 [Candidatus Margulisbacteria bacterium GWE2_39_32]PZM78426.1 MAG: hypothetical protein DKM50_11650 [Candidatus Margulisiibacteriota bacterium]HAR64162.1 hypothetical protein [Candidatus Margulisiibacteriota bacterium]